MEFEGKTVIVTGAAKGIGREIAVSFGREGANVVMGDLKPEECRQTVDEIMAAGGKALAVKCDVSVKKDVESMFDAAVKKFKSVDVLVNNAGIYPFVPFRQMTEEQWDKVIAVNLKSVFNCCKSAAEIMAEQGRGGKIVSISSIAAIKGYPALAHYCASKGAIDGFTRSLAIELAPYKVNVNAVRPGAVRTPGTEPGGEEQYKRTADAVPLKRMGMPKDIANAVLFLASEKADYITGQCLVVDGGMTVQ